MKVLFPVAFVVVLLTSLATRPRAEPPTQPSKRVREFLGDAAVKVLSDATRVEVFRIKPDQEKQNSENIGGYPIIATEKEQGKEFVSQLTNILFTEKTYEFDSHKFCIFSPGIAFRVWRGKECVEALLCFSCDELEIIVKDTQGKARNEPADKHEDFNSARAALLKLSKRAFPADKAIQSLKERRE